MKSSKQLLSEFTHSKEINILWVPENAGGCVSEKTFTKNAFIEVMVTQPNTQIFTQVSSDVQNPLGLYLLQTDKLSLNELSQQEIDLATSNKVFSLNHNSLYFDCGRKPSHILLVPCTYASRVEGRCHVKIESTKPVEIRLGRNRDYQYKQEHSLRIVAPPSYSVPGAKFFKM